ncbi:MAG: MFS transporter, partial [Candidatus Promineifilaceae bacterium]
MPARRPPRFLLQLAALTFGRLLINTGVRMVYPFLPELARGLNAPLLSLSRLVTLRSAVGLFSPLFSPLSERYGRRPAMAAAMLLLALGCAVAAVWPRFWALGLALAGLGLSKVIYDPAMLAYIGDRVPYRQRGRAISATELSW